MVVLSRWTHSKKVIAPLTEHLDWAQTGHPRLQDWPSAHPIQCPDWRAWTTLPQATRRCQNAWQCACPWSAGKSFPKILIEVSLKQHQMSSGGAALMAVQVLVDHGVAEKKIVFVTYSAGKTALHRLNKVFPELKIVVCSLTDDLEQRWIGERYFGC